MTKEFCKIMLLAGTILCSSISAVNAQTCTVAPTCESLGFGQKLSDCANRPVLKCPFDTTKVYCGVYADDSGLEEFPARIGYVMYDKKTFRPINRPIASKKPMGMVVSLNPLKLASFFESSAHFQFYDESNTSLGKYNINFVSNPEGDFSGYDNTAKLVAASNRFQAARYCKGYYAAGTKAGDWYLPAAGELLNYLKNLKSFSNTCVAECDTERNKEKNIVNKIWNDCYEGCSNESDTYSCRNICAKERNEGLNEAEINYGMCMKVCESYNHYTGNYFMSSSVNLGYSISEVYFVNLNLINKSYLDDLYPVICITNIE